MSPKAVGFAGAQWWVIGKDGAGVNSQEKTMTLLSKETLIDDGAFGADNQYSASALKSSMEAYYDGLGAAEKALIQSRELDAMVHNPDANMHNGTLSAPNYVWPLSWIEAEALPQDTLRLSDTAWWLRTAITYESTDVYKRQAGRRSGAAIVSITGMSARSQIAPSPMM